MSETNRIENQAFREAKGAQIKAEKRVAELEGENKRLSENYADACVESILLTKRIVDLEDALRHIQIVMDTQVAKSQHGPGPSYCMSPGGHSGIRAALGVALDPKEGGNA